MFQHAVAKCWSSLSLSVSQQRSPSHPSLLLLFLPKALTASSSNQIPATVQWRGAISDNAIAACLSERTYCM